MRFNKFIILYVIFLIICFEAISYIGYYFFQKEFYSYSKINNLKTSIALNESSAFDTLPTVAHPYLGNVHNPDSGVKIGDMKITSFGFFDDSFPVQKKSEDKLIIGVFGASVAWWYSALGYQHTFDELKKIYPNKKFEIIRLGIGGNKQPQQLMILNYLLSKGAEFDIAINLDGFNEIAIPPTHNLSKGVNPIYPAYWSDLLTEVSSSEEREQLRKILVLEQKRKDSAKNYNYKPIKYSVSANLIWLIQDKVKTVKIENLKLEKQKVKRAEEESKVPYVLRGPRFKTIPEKEYYNDLTDMWMQSSLLMHQLCLANEIKYFHFLQPNQYVPNSKPIGVEEKKVAIDKSAHWEKPVLNGYPMLIEKGKKLKDMGVYFFDLTMIFNEDSDHLYNDNCCHFNVLGNQKIGSKIGELILDNLSSKK